MVVAVGAISFSGARSALRELGPTVGFLAALLLLADGCRRAGMFEALGVWMARGARQRPRRLLAMVFVAAAATTAVLSLDATIVLLTPIVFATAARMRANPRPHVYACSHLANSASLLLPVSNLTNLLAFHASGLSFARFGGLMAAPVAGGARDRVAGAEPVVLRASFAVAEGQRGQVEQRPAAGVRAVRARGDAGRVRAQLGDRDRPGVGRGRRARSCSSCARGPRSGSSCSRPSRRCWCSCSASGSSSRRPASTASRARSRLLPGGSELPALLAVAAISAVVANLVNNLPATLIILPVAAASGPGAVLAMLVGVNVGPNLTYVGSLATLLWRRIVHAHEQETDIAEFTRLGVRTVPAVLRGLDARVVVGSAGPVMRAVVWIAENTWEACVDQAARVRRAPTPRSRCCTCPRATSRTSLRAAPRGCWAAARRLRRGRRCARSPPRRRRRCSRRREARSGGPPALDSRRGHGWSARCVAGLRGRRPAGAGARRRDARRPQEPRPAHALRRRPRAVPGAGRVDGEPAAGPPRRPPARFTAPE